MVKYVQLVLGDGSVEVYSFSKKLAKEIGVIEATFLQILYRIIQENKDICIVEDDICWFPCTIKDWGIYIDLWTYRQTDRIVKNCLLKHALYLRNYDDDERRRRGWYGISKDVIPMLEQVDNTMKSGRP